MCVCVVTCCPKKSGMLATSVSVTVSNHKVFMGKAQSCVIKCAMGAGTVIVDFVHACMSHETHCTPIFNLFVIVSHAA